MALRSGGSSKKNDIMAQQIANSLKMSAYLNKNTFSSSTALPPEENRLNMKDIVSKSGNPIWRQKIEGEQPSYEHRKSERQEERQLRQSSLQKDSSGCKKCGLSKPIILYKG